MSTTPRIGRREELLRLTLERDPIPDLPDPRPRPSTSLRVTERDIELLGFIAAHRFVEPRHVTEWLGADRSIAYRRLARLGANGLVRYERIFHARPGCCRITRGGLAIIGSPLPVPKIDLRTYRHDAGVVWLWLAARAGRYGPCQRLVTEREMRHHDQTADTDQDVYGIQLSGWDRAGSRRRHCPDVLLITAAGGRVALELELSVKGQRRLEDILLAYGLADELLEAVYLTDQPPVARKLEQLIERLGLGERVRCVYSPGWESQMRRGESRRS